MESDYATLKANTAMKLQFWGKTIEVLAMNNPVIELKLPETGDLEKYEFNFLKNSAINLIWGIMSFTHFGDATVKNHNTGDYAKVKVNGATGMFMKDHNKCRFTAEIFAKDATEP